MGSGALHRSCERELTVLSEISIKRSHGITAKF
jgi:hypothetical protein